MHYSILKGPLGSHLNYITHIALENYQDYFEYTNKQMELGKNQENRKYQGFRLFLNAIESMNNILDYFYYEFEKEFNGKKRNFIVDKIKKNHPILEKISDVANAYKHCKQYKESDLHAADLQKPMLNMSVNLTILDVKVKQGFTSIEESGLLDEAFRFWVKYLNDPQPDFLLQDLELSKNISANDNYDIADNVVNLVSQSIGNVIRESEKKTEIL
jgi:hypothetical protein